MAEEQLRIERRLVTTGTVRVQKTVEHVPTQIHQRLLRERFEIERVPIGRVIGGPMAIRQEGDVTIVPVVEERLVLTKELVLVEEWHITRHKHFETYHAHDTLRRDVVTVVRTPSTDDTSSSVALPTTPSRGTDMRTIIAAFDSYEAASRACESLLARGISPGQIHLQGRDAGQATPAKSTSTTAEDHSGFFATVGDFFSRVFGPEDQSGETSQYSEAVRRGGAVLAVGVTDEAQVESISAELETEGAYDIDERSAQWRADGWKSAPRSMESAQSATARATSSSTSDVSDDVLQVVQEELKVGKRQVQAGKVRVVRRVTETPVQEQVQLRDEHVRIERRPVDREATSADLAEMQEQTIELQERTEEPVVQKTARVVEEVIVGTEVRERTETINDSVRRTDVEVERVGGPDSLATDLIDEDEGLEGGRYRQRKAQLTAYHRPLPEVEDWRADHGVGPSSRSTAKVPKQRGMLRVRIPRGGKSDLRLPSTQIRTRRLRYFGVFSDLRENGPADTCRAQRFCSSMYLPVNVSIDCKFTSAARSSEQRCTWTGWSSIRPGVRRRASTRRRR